MANFPLSDGNTSSKLDRIIADNFPAINNLATNATTFLSKEITGPDGDNFVYGVIIIESNGTTGSVLDITQITLRDENGVAVVSGTESDAVQNNLFVLSPLEQTGGSAWTSDVPFMGTHNAAYDTNTNVHTVLPSAITGGADASIVTDSDGAESYLGIQITAGGEISILTSSETGTLANVDAWIPIYNHQYILDNNIPQGRYAAILIKCDPRNVTIDGEIEYTLNIGHNGINHNAEAQDYQLKLRMTGDNIFVPKLSYNSSDEVDGATLPTIKTLMSKIKNDEYTGYSWPTNVAPNLYGWTPSTSSTGPVQHAEAGTSFEMSTANAFAYAESFHQLIESNAFDDSIFVDVNVLDAMVASGGSILEGNKLTAYDGSSYPETFDASLFDGDGFITQSLAPVGKLTVLAGEQGNFNLEHDSSSVFWTSGTMAVDSVSSNYLNFDHTSEDNSKRSSPKMNYEDGNKINYAIQVTQNILIYPLFSYPQQTLNHWQDTINFKSGSSYSVTVDTPYTHQIVEHSGDTIKYFEGNQELSIFTVNEIYSNSYGFTASTQTKSYHNVRINALSTADEITKHLIADNHCDATSVEVRTTTGENTLTKTGAVAADTNTPSASDTYQDYTVMMAHDVVEVTNNAMLSRGADGQYTGVDNFRGYKSNTLNLLAPVTKWKPGGFNGTNHGEATMPFWITQGGPIAKSMQVKHSYFLTRPLFSVGYESTSEGIGPAEITHFEFLNPAGYTADNTTATGAKEWSTGNFRENSRSQLCTADSNLMTCRFNQDTGSGDGADLVSYVDGNEIFNINDSAGFSGVTTRAFIKDFTAGGSGQSTFRVVDKDNVAINANVTITESTYTADAEFDFTLEIGKPVYAAGERKVNFAHDVAIDGSIDERDRINCNYGTDISYTIAGRPINQIKSGDTFYVETGGDHDDINNLHAGATSVEKAVYTANAENSSANGSLTIFNFNPKEKGLYNGAEQILSIRNFNPDHKADVYNSTSSDLIYCNLDSGDFADGSYSQVFKLFPFNAGDEDILMINAEIFDPYYLPAGVFEVIPDGAPTPTWTLTNTHTNNNGTSVSFNSGAPANTGEMLPSQVGGIGSATPLQKSSVQSDGLYTGLQQTLCSLSFTVATGASVAGDYYKAIEFTYYRDSAYGQKRYTADGSTEVRPFGDRPVWKTRKLIKVSIDSHVGIKITDVDETTLTSNDTIDFGSINI